MFTVRLNLKSKYWKVSCVYVCMRERAREICLLYILVLVFICSSELAYSSPPCICWDGSCGLHMECMEQKSEESMCAKLPQCSSQRCEMVSARALPTFLWVWLHVKVNWCWKGIGDSGFQRRSNCWSYKVPSRQFKSYEARTPHPLAVSGCPTRVRVRVQHDTDTDK